MNDERKIIMLKKKRRVNTRKEEVNLSQESIIHADVLKRLSRKSKEKNKNVFKKMSRELDRLENIVQNISKK